MQTHTKVSLSAALVVSAALPFLALAQSTATPANSFDKLGQFLLQFIVFINNVLVPLIFAAAFLVFIWGIYLYFIQGAANEEKRDTGKQFLLYGLIGFFVMVSVWGLVNVLVNSSGLGGQSTPDLPLFSTQASPGTANTSTFPTADQAKDAAKQ